MTSEELPLKILSIVFFDIAYFKSHLIKFLFHLMENFLSLKRHLSLLKNENYISDYVSLLT